MDHLVQYRCAAYVFFESYAAYEKFELRVVV